MDELSILTEPHPDSELVLDLRAVLDLGTKDALLEAVDTARAQIPVTALTIDMAGLRFLDSTGIGAVVAIANLAHENQISFAISRPSPPARRILDITGLSTVWSIDTDE